MNYTINSRGYSTADRVQSSNNGGKGKKPVQNLLKTAQTTTKQAILATPPGRRVLKADVYSGSDTSSNNSFVTANTSFSDNGNGDTSSLKSSGSIGSISFSDGSGSSVKSNDTDISLGKYSYLLDQHREVLSGLSGLGIQYVETVDTGVHSSDFSGSTPSRASSSKSDNFFANASPSNESPPGLDFEKWKRREWDWKIDPTYDPYQRDKEPAQQSTQAVPTVGYQYHGGRNTEVSNIFAERNDGETVNWSKYNPAKQKSTFCPSVSRIASRYFGGKK